MTLYKVLPGGMSSCKSLAFAAVPTRITLMGTAPNRPRCAWCTHPLDVHGAYGLRHRRLQVRTDGGVAMAVKAYPCACRMCEGFCPSEVHHHRAKCHWCKRDVHVWEMD